MVATKLTLKNMIFYGYHGVYPAEKEMGQRIEVDLELRADFSQAHRQDELEATINYVEVYGVIKRIVEDGAYNLIEGIATAIVQELLEKFSLNSVTVRVRKPQPPVGGLMDAVEYELTESALVREGK